MNYHNFASRLSTPRVSRLPQAKTSTKPPHKGPRRSPVRRTAAATAIAMAMGLLAFGSFCPKANATSTTATPLNPPAKAPVNLPTLIVTIAGVTVALLRAPQLWRRDFVW